MTSTDKLEDFLARELDFPKHNAHAKQPVASMVKSDELNTKKSMFN